MKFLFALFVGVFALPALANQPYRGPLLTRDIGKEGENVGLISSCQLLKNNPNIKWDEVRKDIEQAIKDGENPRNFEKRLYIKFNAPAKSYVAYMPIESANKPPQLKQVVLFSDGGSYDLLKTDAARRLLKIISENCGALRPGQGFDRGLGLAEAPEDDIFESLEFKANGSDFK